MFKIIAVAAFALASMATVVQAAPVATPFELGVINGLSNCVWYDKLDFDNKLLPAIDAVSEDKETYLMYKAGEKMAQTMDVGLEGDKFDVCVAFAKPAKKFQ
jgi:hypothetical protein